MVSSFTGSSLGWTCRIYAAGGRFRIRDFRYRAVGRLESVQENGTRLVVRWSPTGTLLGMDVDHQSDGTVDEVVTYSIEPHAVTWTGSDRSGAVSFRATYEYDPHGRLTDFVSDIGGDGRPDIRTDFTYRQGRVTGNEDHSIATGGTMSQMQNQYVCR